VRAIRRSALGTASAGSMRGRRRRQEAGQPAKPAQSGRHRNKHAAVGTQADASNAAEALANSISVGMQWCYPVVPGGQPSTEPDPDAASTGPEPCPMPTSAVPLASTAVPKHGQHPGTAGASLAVAHKIHWSAQSSGTGQRQPVGQAAGDGPGRIRVLSTTSTRPWPAPVATESPPVFRPASARTPAADHAGIR
jgi:hypothetical protein